MRALHVVTGLALTAALAGCSNDDDKKADESKTPAASSTPSGTPDAPSSDAADDPKAALEKAYRTYIDAFLGGDGATAYELLSERCREKEPLSEFAAGAESAAELYGKIEYSINSVTVNGNEGRVSAKFPVEALQGGDPRGSLWVLEDGEWHSDKCGD